MIGERGIHNLRALDREEYPAFERLREYQVFIVFRKVRGYSCFSLGISVQDKGRRNYSHALIVALESNESWPKLQWVWHLEAVH